MSETVIKIENLTKVYRLGTIGGTTLREELERWFHRVRGVERPWEVKMKGKFKALDDISFHIEKGERVGIIGHNGAGKSTLLKLLCRITAPTSGRISYNGRISSMLEVGTGFHGDLTGRENVYLNGTILGMSRQEIDSKLDAIVEFAEMSQFIDTPVKHYSSGMYVKLAFSVAAHLDNEIMIMDEVLAVGDANFQRKCLQRMNDVSANTGRTILYVSHNMGTIRELCTRCLVLSQGRLIYDGDVENAIALYLDNGDAGFPKHVDLDPDKRPPYGSHRIRLLSLDFLNRNITSIGQNEPLEFELHLQATVDLDDVRFRFVVNAPDGSPVGILPGFESMVLKAGEHTLRFSLDLSALAPGEYSLNIIPHAISGLGGQERYDMVKQTAHFMKAFDGAALGHLRWSVGAWGHTLFPPAGITRL